MLSEPEDNPDWALRRRDFVTHNLRISLITDNIEI